LASFLAYPGLGDRVFDNQNGFEYWPAPKLQPPALLGLLGLASLAGIASASVAVANMRGWYAALTPPPLTPPNPMPMAGWGLLAIIYVLMAGAAWQVLRPANPATHQRSAIFAWGWQLALGAAWPAVFFGFHAMLAALVIAAMLVASIAATIRQFARLDLAAAILLVPNLAWAGFLIYLNAGFWWLNQ
jgi:tryptophan-rich sensory protein